MKILGIPVIFDPLSPRVAEARGLWPRQVIAVGPEWHALTHEERLAVLYHEAGHCVRFHREKRWLWLPLVILTYLGELAGARVKRMCHEQEMQADRFAAEAGFKEPMSMFLARHDRAEDRFYPSCDERIRALASIQGAKSC